jgi:hypothetical protein
MKARVPIVASSANFFFNSAHFKLLVSKSALVNISGSSGFTIAGLWCGGGTGF